MAQEREYFVLCKDKCLFPAMDKEQTITAIQQAVSTGTIQNIDAGFITKIQELNAQNQLQFWVGTTAEYNAITEKADNTLYLLTDDNTLDVDGIVNSINELQTKADNLATKDTEIDGEITTINSTLTGLFNGSRKVKISDYAWNLQKETNWISFDKSTFVFAEKKMYEVYFEYPVGVTTMAEYFIVSVPSGVTPSYVWIKAFSFDSNEGLDVYIRLIRENNGYKLELSEATLYANPRNFKYREIR